MGHLTISVTSKNKCAFDSVISLLENLSHRNTDHKPHRNGNIYIKNSADNFSIHKYWLTIE